MTLCFRGCNITFLLKMFILETNEAWYRSSLVTFYNEKSGVLYTPFVSQWLTGFCREAILSVGTRFIGCCLFEGGRCREVKIRVNVWTVRRDHGR